MSRDDYDFLTDRLALPRGAVARAARRHVVHRGTRVLGFVAGRFRPCCHPVLTPAGFATTAESPADHPHHNSLWIAADHVGLQVPAGEGGVESYEYNFYVDEVFQGRAPGRLIERSCEGAPLGAAGFAVTQEIDWRGPAEWGAPEGRLALRETRRTTIREIEGAYRMDISSRLAAGEIPVRLGPTRHAYFNVRVAETMVRANGGVIRSERGVADGAAISAAGAEWVDFTGPVGGGARAGLTVIPRPAAGETATWFVADWGVVTVGTFRDRALTLEAGDETIQRCTIIVHDGEISPASVEALKRGGFGPEGEAP
ncbi:hypothetical protein G5B40_07130 [Pikeienuella piscinae]|uniref:Uncharacterized protein n=1 Tax=Pikeienuella piscinae TaxID=2748098 RepID=A0A7L5BU32_9RHOB|nr:DUF6807 family protein [Pikeienuella piscinae]QIE55245.1 hypothetical protein G5B40_07130 [Pikeienuella piscinae]